MDYAPYVKLVRKSTGLTQHQFADAYNISVDNIKAWEQGRRSPDGTAQSYLRVIEADPERIKSLNGNR